MSDTRPKLYRHADVDDEQLCEVYFKHCDAMTTESLHSKADIAWELAWRDWRIAKLEGEAGRLREENQNLRAFDEGHQEARCEMLDAMRPFAEALKSSRPLSHISFAHWHSLSKCYDREAARGDFDPAPSMEATAAAVADHRHPMPGATASSDAIEQKMAEAIAFEAGLGVGVKETKKDQPI